MIMFVKLQFDQEARRAIKIRRTKKQRKVRIGGTFVTWFDFLEHHL